MTGALADLTSISRTAPIAKNGDWPVCIDLYSHQGLLHGWVNFSSGTPVGRLSWEKPALATAPSLVNKMYPAGVNNLLDVFGSLYHATSPTIALSTGALELNVPASNPSTYPIAVTNNNSFVSPAHITGTVATATGLITLSLPSTVAGGVARTAHGVVLQSSNSAFGTVGGTNAAIYLH
jgi:hypothetical protein